MGGEEPAGHVKRERHVQRPRVLLLLSVVFVVRCMCNGHVYHAGRLTPSRCTYIIGPLAFREDAPTLGDTRTGLPAAA